MVVLLDESSTNWMFLIIGARLVRAPQDQDSSVLSLGGHNTAPCTVIKY